jgi:chloramphenicol-sensitive protein RarD
LKNLSQQAQGYVYALLAFLQWGLFPVYFKLLSSVAPMEVLAHRILWSVVVLLAIIYLSKQFQKLRILFLNTKAVLFLMLSAILVSSNWLIYIWAVSNNMLTEASLGYYINPLISTMLGIVFYKDRPTLWQKVAIFLGFLAILYQVMSLGSLPLVSLGLGFSFAFYGYVRKKVNVPSALGLTIETLLLFPFALGYFFYLEFTHTNMFIFPPDFISILLLLAGFITVLPLLCFNAATTRISLMHIGFFQYIGPTLGFYLAVCIYDELLSQEKLITFLFIWLALVIFSVDAYKNRKR